MSRSLSKLVPGLLAAATRSAGASTLASCGAALLKEAPAAKLLGTVLSSHARTFHSSVLSAQATSPEAVKGKAPSTYEPARKFRSLADKELWHEAWMYEDRFGTEDAPIVVPSLEGERIIGVTDPEDDNLVVWGILREGEAARQFIEGGEYYVLKKVPYITKVGDVLELEEAGSGPALAK